MSPGAIAGIVIGCLIFLCFFLLPILFYLTEDAEILEVTEADQTHVTYKAKNRLGKTRNRTTFKNTFIDKYGDKGRAKINEFLNKAKEAVTEGDETGTAATKEAATTTGAATETAATTTESETAATKEETTFVSLERNKTKIPASRIIGALVVLAGFSALTAGLS